MKYAMWLSVMFVRIKIENDWIQKENLRKDIGAKLILYSGAISSIYVISGVGKKGYFPIDTHLYLLNLQS